MASHEKHLHHIRILRIHEVVGKQVTDSLLSNHSSHSIPSPTMCKHIVNDIKALARTFYFD